MGIKGIYAELGPGKRVSLSKIAADSFENEGRPFRIAIDIAIWQFQTKAARGGTNPAIRTLFYRLVRLLGTPVEPIFVFDGPHKPAIKRNKRSGLGDRVATAQAKKLIELFGFPMHDAPGEAEAECALLQRHGIVDAVLSEDVDTLMFGCSKVLRNWSAEGKASKTPTHISLYDVQHLDAVKLGLDRQGMVLVALMSGGDYLPAGIPGCGVRIACEAARAGFGKSLCRLKISDKAGVRAWRDNLVHELETNEHRHFRTKHMALTVPEDFPNMEVCRYYTHPVVTPISKLDTMKHFLLQERSIQLDGLREFTRETFGWDFRTGAIKFIRVLGQALLVRKICQDNINGEAYVKRILGRRRHFSTDATPELRLSYIPEEVVPIDLSREMEENITFGRDGLALNSDEEFIGAVDAVASSVEPNSGPGNVFDAQKPNLVWVLERVVRMSIPGVVNAWEDAEQARSLSKPLGKKKATGKKGKAAGPLSHRPLDAFVHITKTPADDSGGINHQFGEAQKRNQIKNMAQSESRTMRRPKLPTVSRQPSKQSMSSPACDPATVTADWIDASSPVTPRQENLAGYPETIVISSSPITATSSPLSSPTRPHIAPSSSEEVLSSLLSTISLNTTPCQLGEKRKQSEERKPPLQTSAPIKPGKLKQMSMDSFAKMPQHLRPDSSIFRELRDVPTAKDMRQVEALDDAQDQGSPNLEPLSSILARKITESDYHRSRSAVPSPRTLGAVHSKKKVLIPSTVMEGFINEIEVEVQERDAMIMDQVKLLGTRGTRVRAQRWSDVSVIDLTQME